MSTPEVRDLRFDLSDVPRHWHGGSRAITAWFDNLSVFFPPGERFFVAAVKAHQSKVTDRALSEEAQAFCAQEGHHSREHVRYNKLLSSQGYPVEAMERRVERLLRFVSRHTSPRRQLAVTCALEHFTSLMGALVLGDARIFEGAHPTMAALWRWHAAEENEHKCVAYDVYQATGGTWLLRCWLMLVTTWVFWLKVWGHQVRLMHHDGALFSPREWWALFRFLFLNPGGLGSLWRPYLAYFSPRFHPSHLDHGHLLAAWKAQFQGAPEYRQAQVS